MGKVSALDDVPLPLDGDEVLYAIDDPDGTATSGKLYVDDIWEYSSTELAGVGSVAFLDSDSFLVVYDVEGTMRVRRVITSMFLDSLTVIFDARYVLA